MNVYNQMFIAKPLLARIWEKLRCSSVSEWVYRLWHIQTMDSYSELNWNEILNHKRHGEIVYGFKYMMLWKMQNYCKKSWLPKVEWEQKWTGGAQRIWGTMKLFCILHNTIRMNTFVKVHRMYNTKSELKC